MALAVGAHVGPWTEADLVGLPDDLQRYELLEGTLHVNPPPGGAHQLVSLKLAAALHAAVTPGLAVVEAMGVRLLEDSLFIPDIVVAARDAVVANRSGVLDPETIVLVVEIVSPGSRTADRLTKPTLYAGVGIVAFWRVELDDGPVIITYDLEQDRYVETATARPGETLTVDKPFPFTVDPIDLQP
jgi:Uma2 family endonuclease